MTQTTDPNNHSQSLDPGQTPPSNHKKSAFGDTTVSVPQFSTNPAGGTVLPVVGRFDKEAEPSSFASLEISPVVDLSETAPEIPPELVEYVEKVDKQNFELERPIVHGGKVVLDSTNSDQFPQIVLPMTRQSLQAGVTQKVNFSVRWLAEWCVRLIKKFRQRVVFIQENQQS